MAVPVREMLDVFLALAFRGSAIAAAAGGGAAS
jgi:hypothetical protein